MDSYGKMQELVNKKIISDSRAEIFKRDGYIVIGTIIEGVLVTYSVGLSERFNHPEIVVLGVVNKTAAKIINFIVAKIKEGLVIDTRMIYGDILGNEIKCLFTEAQSEHLNVLNYIYPDKENKALALVCGDKNNKIYGLDTGKEIMPTEPIYSNFIKLKMNPACFHNEVEPTFITVE